MDMLHSSDKGDMKIDKKCEGSHYRVSIPPALSAFSP